MSEEILTNGQILAQALNLINTDRQSTYGDTKTNHDRIAKIWSVILDQPIEGYQVALCMAGVKLARLVNDPMHQDSYIDGAAYFAIAGELVDE